MTIRINNIVLGLDDDIEVVKKRVSKKLKVSIDEIENFKIIKESLDAITLNLHMRLKLIIKTKRK